ncbi:disease resistance protein RGA2-like [Triticum dicoccoides]|uniref:disease resistance protein RGA2-like n=1 Tax=Triticum dicoccoides TaxID=85692 RepID=UPI000E79E512|nr:disease resistance protein RGA2-like [Triticum dicoccoides]XP_037454976.1 disease resistance protein RGA2-like [Triticum dicoccoides]XP_037454983.1 disease resistance protein RGA2-like [Triticum dicoccoides]XP_037454988.1 disease resistance protein RGA2-like [Triticum dicoccoides]XP_037454996.1 disease resistance protein RGA2-like [Triticum dicoccoides]XP_037455003.1 disease resistance protein RGA2-like [Triticum dicoccoides]XP_037455010.1 disease resistance protein RGA2-like [Triticum dic
MDFAVNAALWVVGKALAPVADGLLESWAASAGLGPNIDDLKMQLLYAQGMLDSAQGRDIRSSALKELLHKLRELAYGADDVLDELDYFRIQDALDGTYHAAADVHTQGGFVSGLVLNARHTAYAVGKHFSCHSSPSVQDDDAHTAVLEEESSSTAGSGRRFFCGAWPSKAPQRNQAMQTPKLKFDRVEMSRKMMEIVEQMKPLSAMVSTILDKEMLGSVIMKLDLLGSKRTPSQDTAMNRPNTTPEIVEPEFYGRDDQKKEIVDGITHGDYCKDELTVVPLVGPGGIGKTTLTQHIYRELESSFQVSVWICVSLDFNANRLAQEIVKKIPKVNDEKENASDTELIQQRLKSKRLLLVLDDMWTYNEDEWIKLLAPLKHKGGEKGNVIIATTRIPEVASMVRTSNSSIINVERLGPKDIMSFFEVCVFGYQQPWEGHYELRDVGEKIVTNLKGFPLAAKTVGRLLRKKLKLDHWITVADSREWELQTRPNDIMPALKLSYDYLPFHLQKCFSYCALFPEDYEFGQKELVHLWIGLGILHSCGQKKRIEDVGLHYLDDLVNYGFFKKNEKEDGPYYVIHDLLHELAVNVSSYECLSIYSSSMRSIQIPPSVRHLSIIIDNTDVRDTMTFQEYKSYLSALSKRLRVQNLRTLMLFGEYHGSFVNTFRDLFRDAGTLRTVVLSGASYSVEDMLLNFSKLVHLRYVRIKSVCNPDMCLPSVMIRSYHLEVIDLEKWGGSFGSTRHMSNLVKLRHFHVPKNNAELHSNIYEVGKLKFLEELRRFEVGKEATGFELSQLGDLTELGGSLGICNLEKVHRKDEGKELKLIHKNHLHKLTLEWDAKRSVNNLAEEQNVIESLVPHNNLQDLCIRGHRGANCPSWLGGHLTVENLKYLSLCDVSWKTFPPLGELRFIDDPSEECKGLVSSQSFQILKRLELVEIPKLAKWVGNGRCHLFSVLEVIIIQDCPELAELPFSHPNCHQAKQEENMIWFPKLTELKIIRCPKLVSLPPIPWTEAPCSVVIGRAGSVFERLIYRTDYKSELSLEIEGKDGQHGVLWNGLAFHNLAGLKELEVKKCPPLPLIHLQKLKSLKTLKITGMCNELLVFEGESYNTECPLPVQHIQITECNVIGKELTLVLSHFPKLTRLAIFRCEKITELGAAELQTETATPSSSAHEIEHAQAGYHQHQQTRGEEVEEAAAGGGGLLLLPRQLQELIFFGCRELWLLSDSLGAGGLQSLCSLRSLDIYHCPRFLSSYSSSASSCFPFPTSLQELLLNGVEGMETLAPLSNLISLTSLSVFNCGDLRSEGLWPLVAQGCLAQFKITGTPKFFTGSEPSRPHDQEIPSSSSKLEHLWTDDWAGILTVPICTLLSSSLTKLILYVNKEVERFTEKQEEALHLLNSLQELEFWNCGKLQRFPAGLTKLASLKILRIRGCPAIQLLPKDRLPSSLQELEIRSCPAIKSLPKDTLPSSLRKLEACYGISEELKSQCRKLKGTIPIIKDYINNDY